MKVLNQTIEVKSNNKQRTFTIRTYVDGVLSSKYRTIKMSKEEFNSSQYYTSNDWNEFLKTNDYYLVK